VEDANQALGSIVDALGLVDEHLEGAILDPLLHILLVLLGVDRTHVLVVDDEATHRETLDEELVDVVDGVRGGVVLRDHTADDDTAEVVNRIQRSLEVLAADVLIVDVDALRGETGQRSSGLLSLVVEATVEAELLDDVVKLLVRAHGSNDLQTLALGQLADELAHGTGGRRHEDGLALLGLANVVQGRVGGQTRHTQRTQEDADILEAEGVLELVNETQALAIQSNNLLNGNMANDQVALLIVGVV